MDHRINEETVAAALHLSRIGGVPPEAARRLALFLGEVDFWSGKVHLVGKGRLESSMKVLLLDSLALLWAAESSALTMKRVADIGSGAGFPGLVWKIVRPAMKMTLFERRLKPQSFLERAVARLGLDGAAVVGEAGARSPWEGAFDLVTSKAAGRVGSILPLAERLLAPGGAYITVKGSSWEKEMPERDRFSVRLETLVELPEMRGTALIFRKGHSA
jgi:16S rRNA (guanine527-N7)-methyltransferase